MCLFCHVAVHQVSSPGFYEVTQTSMAVDGELKDKKRHNYRNQLQLVKLTFLFLLLTFLFA